MIWKTDWVPEDDYAADATGDIERLFSNYSALRDAMNNKLGFHVSFTLPGTSGRLTLPFADFLNAIEFALNSMRVFSLPEWGGEMVTWMPAGIGPNHQDVNRWERNGEMLEDALSRIQRTLDLGWALGIAHTGLYGGI